MDSAGDGACCRAGAGGWSIAYQGATQLFSPFEGGYEESAVFGINCPDLGPVVPGSETPEAFSSEKQQAFDEHITTLAQYKLAPGHSQHSLAYNEDTLITAEGKRNPTYPND